MGNPLSRPHEIQRLRLLFLRQFVDDVPHLVIAALLHRLLGAKHFFQLLLSIHRSLVVPMSLRTPESMMERSAVRSLSPVDLTDALDLSRLAGWNQTEADWRRLLALSPHGCFCIEQGHRVVATATLVAYEVDCAWIGMVLTHPDWRGRGFARRLVGHTLDFARSLGIGSIKLDATVHGQALYESFGFTPEQDVARWERPGISASSGSSQSYSLSLDEAAYGYNRADLLESLSPGAHRIGRADPYVLARPGSIRSYLGPCIAEDPETARQLLTPVLNAVPESGWFWDLLVENRDAMALASALGFKPVRRLVRMSLGPPLREREEKIYALAGFEFG